MKTGISIGGGGSLGSYHAGYIQGSKLEFDVGGGTSTGALALPFVLLKDYHTLRKSYTSFSTNDIINDTIIAPDGDIKELKTALRIVKTFLPGTRKSLGYSGALFDIIRKAYTQKHHQDLKDAGKIAYVNATNLTTEQEVIISSDSNSLEKFQLGMYASACAPFIMSLVKDGDAQLQDGGIVNNHLTEFVIKNHSPDEMHLFVHQRNVNRNVNNGPIKNAVHMAKISFKTLFNSAIDTDLLLGRYSAALFDIPLFVHYLPSGVELGNAFVFNTEQMTRNYELGLKNGEQMADTIVYSKDNNWGFK